jgi:hypothetical protein
MLNLLALLVSTAPIDLTRSPSILPAEETLFGTSAITLSCPEEAKLFCGGSTAPEETGFATATTTCSTAATVTYSDAPASFTNCPTDRFESIIERTWTATDACGNSASCLQLVVTIRQVWELDILPGVCPNDVDPLNTTGNIQVVISGLPAQNVSDLVPGSLGIWRDDCTSGPVAPASTGMADVSTPFFMSSPCGCHVGTGDGIPDLVLTFSRAALMSGLNLNALADGTEPRLVVTGLTTSGCTFLAHDCVRVQRAPDCNGNGVPDSVDIANGTSFDLDLDGVPDTCQGTQGCSHGYWKNHPASWPATGYAVNQDFDTVFGVNAFTPNRTLLQALQSGGGGINNLGRQGVAALLDASHPNVDFPLTQDEVILAVQNAVLSGNAGTVAAQLDVLVNLGCPLH